MTLYGKKQARRSIVDTVLFRAGSQVFTVLGYIVMVRGMTERDFGLFNLLYAIIPVISTLGSLGLEQMLRRYQPEFLQAGRKEAAGRLVRVVASLRFAASIAIIGLMLLTWNSFAHWFQLEPYRDEFALFAILILIHFQARVIQIAMASHMLHRYSVGSMAVLSFGKFLAYSGFAWFGALNLQTAIYSDIAAYVVCYLVLRTLHRRLCHEPAAASFRFEPSERKRLAKYAIIFNFNDAGSLALNVRAENFFLAAILGPIAVGAYAFYSRLSIMAGSLLPVRLFENVVNPLFFSTRQEHAPERVPRYFTALLNTSLLVQVPMLAYAIACHREIVTVLFGGKFIEYSYLLPLVMGFATANVIAVPVTLVAQYMERAFVVLKSKVFALYNIAALLLLVPRIGVLGAVLAVGSADLFKNLYIWWHVRNLARWQNAPGAVGAAVLCWGTYIAAVIGLDSAFDIHPIAKLAFAAVLVAPFTLVYMRSSALCPNDRTLFGSVLHGRETRLLRLLGLTTPAPVEKQ